MKTGDSFNLNLLPSQAKFQAARMKLQKTFRRYMAIGAIVWVLVIVGTVISHIFVGVSLEAENKKYKQNLEAFKGMTDEITLSQLIKYRIKVLGQVLKDRFEYSTAFERVTTIFSEKATVSKFQINENKEFVITVTTNNQEGVDYIESRVEEANKGKIEGIKEVEINNVAYTNDGNWSVNMGVKIE